MSRNLVRLRRNTVDARGAGGGERAAERVNGSSGANGRNQGRQKSDGRRMKGMGGAARVVVDVLVDDCRFLTV